MKTPSEILMETIIPLLVKKKMLLAKDAETYKGKLAQGTMKAEDWLLAIEKAAAKEGGQ
jgi:hypothetical protein